MTTKSFHTFLQTTMLVVALLLRISVFAQDKAPPSPVPPPPPPGAPDLKPILEDVRRQVEIAREQVSDALGVATEAVTAPWAGVDEFEFVTRPGSRPARSLVVPKLEMDPPAMADAEEDLAVMARIFEKALPGREGDKAERRAMGIPIMSSGGGAPVRNLLLEGYGAVFLLEVRFPLLPPEKPKPEPKSKDEKSSAWEDARSELYAPRGPRRNAFVRLRGPSGGEMEDYDEDRVQRLQDALLEALKHATHIRALKSNDVVNVIITGAGGGQQDRVFVKELSGPEPGRGEHERQAYSVNATGYVRTKSPRGGGTLAIRAVKSDINAFAEGKLDLDQFRKKAVVQIY